MISSIARVVILARLALPGVLGAPAMDPVSIRTSDIEVRTEDCSDSSVELITRTNDNTSCSGDAVWRMFQSQRKSMLVRLAVPIEDCWARPVTWLPGYQSPIFGVCFDWHSAVHAAYSLYAITGATGDEQYREKADMGVRNDLVLEEIDYMNKAKMFIIPFLEIETPYGMAWMLKLTTERKEVTGDHGLLPLAELAVAQLTKLITQNSAEVLKKQSVIPSHYNLTWAMIQLWQWAKYIQSNSLQRLVQEKMLPILMDPSFDESCPAVADTTSDYEEFFPPCLTRIAGVVELWNGTSEELKSWVDDRIPPNFTIPAVTQIDDPTAHRNAINFSRAYALWFIYKATGNAKFRSNYATLITYQMTRRDFWDIEAGYTASHFVPQLGVMAIEASQYE